MLLFLSLSAADQEVWLCGRLVRGAVNRTADVRRCAGGKAVNAARAAAILGGESLVAGFFGRGQGLVERLAAEGIAADPIYTECATRRAASLIDRERGEVTELVEEACPPSASEYAALEELFLARARQAAVICLCGSLPPGLRADFYAHLMRRAGHPRAIVDAQGDALSAALGAGPFLVKPNRREAGELIGAQAASLPEVAAQARELCRRGAAHAAVSCGAEGVVLAGDGVLLFRPPRVDAVNTTGCGDAVTGGIAFGLAAGLPVREAVRLGVACGTASAADPLPAGFERARAERIGGGIAVDSI
ncbi:MAG TPA: hypothetical protein DCM87_18135 [Planctomycetes bacterium]|nr:hypothetical protein [Planctomycetota bacterium]